MIDVAELHILPGLLRHITQERLTVEVEVVRVPGNGAWTELESGRFDLVIGTPWKTQPSLYRQRLMDEQYVWIARAGHPLLAQLPTVEGYLRAVHCSLTPRRPTLGRLEAALPALSPYHKIALQMPDFRSVPALVGQSDLVAAVPLTLMSSHPERDRLSVFALPISQSRFTVMQHCHGRVQEDPANRWLRKTVHDVVPSQLKERKQSGKLNT